MECGYRHIDTAFNYNNEEAIGKSLKNWFNKGGKREELFVTSKVIGSYMKRIRILCSLIIVSEKYIFFF